MKRVLNRVVLDTNLLLLWLVARTDATLLQRFKRVKQFTYQDFEQLRDILQPYRESVTTPHILSETSNFIDQAPHRQRTALVTELKDFIRSGVEIYGIASVLIERDEFNALGLTDTGMAQLSAEAGHHGRLPPRRKDRSDGRKRSQLQSLSKRPSFLTIDGLVRVAPCPFHPIP